MSRKALIVHLDRNNVYVNSVNHRYDALEFLRTMPNERMVYMHVAGHYAAADDLLIDTHGADVIDPVWALLDASYRIHGVAPTLLERDFNIPTLAERVREVEHLAQIQRQPSQPAHPSHETVAALPEFQRDQLAFAAHIRDPKAHPRPTGGGRTADENLYRTALQQR